MYADFSFTLMLSNPCPIATLTSVIESPFTDMKYILGEKAESQALNIGEIIGINTLIDCGPINFEFFDEND